MASKFDKVEKCYAFFLQCYETRATFDLQNVAAATGWSLSTVRTYSTKRWDSFLTRVADQFQVADYFSTFTPETFIQHHSQKDIVKKYFYQLLVEKSLSACISAIEIYNKPDFKFREESFSILMVNAWELLLKAKILQLNGDDIGSIWYWKSGEPERGPSGNPKTIAVSKAISILTGNGALKPIVAESIKLLIEVRDESIHFIHDDMDLGTKIQGLFLFYLVGGFRGGKGRGGEDKFQGLDFLKLRFQCFIGINGETGGGNFKLSAVGQTFF